ncbi:hypothetical protein KGF54_001163 [Candida jiufengensis]|uniref:uncharacterized protein n=1 Tax=Candida jiufengensis TaxID=497108 RepID=UPI0022247A8E|nr:uncharacterized protein KGF54_001163 [Candida jiufengensis]KAI5955661.1 hypothetical protein KGF54_001163 [Candida jiufengensis]
MNTSNKSSLNPTTPNSLSSSTSMSKSDSQKSNNSSINDNNRITLRLSDIGNKSPTKNNFKPNKNGILNKSDSSWQQNKQNPQLTKISSQSSQQKQQRPIAQAQLYKSKNRSDTNITSLNLNHNKRKSTSSTTTPPSTTPPFSSKSSDNLKNLLDRDRITPPVFEEDGTMSYFNLDKSKRPSIGSNNFAAKDRKKQSSLGSSNNTPNELLNSPRFLRDFKRSTSNNNVLSTSNINNHNNPKDQLHKEQKNRLVDQFYNKLPNSPQNNGDISKLLQNNLNDSNDSDFLSSLQNSNLNLNSLSQALNTPKNGEKKFKWDQDESNNDDTLKIIEQLQDDDPKSGISNTSTTTSRSFDLKANEELIFNILNNGGFSFQYDVKHVIEDDKLVNYLINIDNIIDESLRLDKANYKKNEKLQNDPMDQLTKIISSISDKIILKSKLLIYSKSNPIKLSILQLNIISNYLTNLNIDIINLKKFLTENLTNIEIENKEIISKNLKKLDEINENINKFDLKLNFYKDKISKSKQYMNDELNKKISLIESINNKIQNQKQLKRSKNYFKFSAIISIGIILFSVIWYYRS